MNKEPRGEFRVFGPPGTGKTHYLSNSITRASDKYTPDDLLVVSFTRSAAHEIASRTEIPGMDKRVGTLHSFCYRALGQPELAETSAHIKEWNKYIAGKNPSLRRKVRGEGDDPLAQSIDGKPLLRYHLCRSQMVDRDNWPYGVKAAATAWEDWKAETGYMDFTDLIEKSLEDVAYAPGCPSVGFFDEVQDFSALELALVRKWGQKMKQTIMAGDDDQSIYGFRGATPDAFLLPPVDPEHKKFLRESYRLPSKIKDYAERWISRVSHREPKEYKARREGGIVKLDHSLTYKNPHPVLRAVCEDLDEGMSVMVLSSCAYMLSPLLEKFKGAGVPFHNPYRRQDGRWNTLRVHKGAGFRLASYLRPDPKTWEDPRLWTWRELWRWVEVIDSKKIGMLRGSKESIKRVIKGKGADELVDLQTIADIFTQSNLVAAQNLITQIEKGDPEFMRENILKTHYKAAMRMALKVQGRVGGKALRETPRLVAGTIHSVKGGSADSVYLFPDLSMEGDSQSRLDPDSLTRLFYVGMTRAREKVTFCGAETPRAVSWIY